MDDPGAATRSKEQAWLWIVLAIIAVPVLFFGGCATLVAIGMHSDDSSTSSGGSPHPDGGLNQQVRDGKFEFVVSDVSVATHWYGDPKPRGQWVIATMTVRNIGKEPQSFFVQNQKLLDAAGNEYAADSMAAMSMNQDSMALDLGPGFTITVKVPFDVPPGTAPDKVELHDSAFSGGATVKVS